MSGPDPNDRTGDQGSAAASPSAPEHLGPGLTLHGIVLVAEDFEGQVAFYRDELGLPLVEDWGDAVRFRAANGVELTLFASSHDQRSLDRLAPGRHGLSHLEFGVDGATERDLDQRLIDRGRRSHGKNYLDADGQLFHFVPRDGGA